MKKIEEVRQKAVLDYILSLGWQDTEDKHTKEVLEDADKIAEKLYKKDIKHLNI